MSEDIVPERPRAGFCALVGAPNAGKSTLLNRLVGGKVSIVSRKVQTTRSLIRGVTAHGDAQVVLVDTPGVFAPKRRLDRAMLRAAWSGASDADAIVVLVDAQRGHDADVSRVLEGVKKSGRKAILALNKVDAVRRESLLALSAELHATGLFTEVFMISALDGSGVDALLDHLAKAMPPGPWLYPPDQMADAPMRFLASEITREQIYDRLHEELPYHSTVETESWKELKDGSARIEQTIYVTRDSQKSIVLGKGGATIKAISQRARTEIERMTGRKAHLFLFVKVRENWGDDPERYREMGLDFNV